MSFDSNGLHPRACVQVGSGYGQPQQQYGTQQQVPCHNHTMHPTRTAQNYQPSGGFYNSNNPPSSSYGAPQTGGSYQPPNVYAPAQQQQQQPQQYMQPQQPQQAQPQPPLNAASLQALLPGLASAVAAVTGNTPINTQSYTPSNQPQQFGGAGGYAPQQGYGQGGQSTQSFNAPQSGGFAAPQATGGGPGGFSAPQGSNVYGSSSASGFSAPEGPSQPQQGTAPYNSFSQQPSYQHNQKPYAQQRGTGGFRSQAPQQGGFEGGGGGYTSNQVRIGWECGSTA